MEARNPGRVLTCYYRPKPGGFCTRYLRAINALLDRGCAVHYLAVVRFPIDRPNCFFHRFPWPQDKTDSLLFWAVFHVLAPIILIYLGFRWRITHCFAFGANYAYLLQPVRIAKQLRLVLFLRGDSFSHHGTKNRPAWLRRLDQLIEGFGIIDASVYCVAEFLGRQLATRHRWMYPRSIATLRNDIYLSSEDKKLFVGVQLRLGCVGMLEPHKNQELLFNVLSKLNNDTITLEVYGAGPDCDRLDVMAKRLEIDSRVNLRGWIDSRRIWEEIDLLLMPSLYEGCPNAVCEALGYFVPVLASDIPAHSEILPQTNLLPANSVEAWCSSLRKIADNREKEMNLLLASQTKKMQELIFDWDKCVYHAIMGYGSDSQY